MKILVQARPYLGWARWATGPCTSLMSIYGHFILYIFTCIKLKSYLFVHSYFAKRRVPDEGIREDYNKMDGSVPAPSVNHTAEPSHVKEGKEAVIGPKKVHKPGIMERNDTAHTSEVCIRMCTFLLLDSKKNILDVIL